MTPGSTGRETIGLEVCVSGSPSAYTQTTYLVYTEGAELVDQLLVRLSSLPALIE